MELLRTQIKTQWPHIFLILEAKRIQNNNAELSNSPVKGKIIAFEMCVRNNFIPL